MTQSQIVRELKDVTFEKAFKDWSEIKSKTEEEIQNINGRSRLGCNLIDYYFFEQRIETIGNKGINFFKFVDDIENYKKKKYIQTLLMFCDNNNRYKDSLVKKYYYCLMSF
jgi:hypothetical protein